MYVVAFDDFMHMRSVQSHHELLDQGLLVEFQSQMGDAVFVSHQWTGFTHPDGNFEQLRVLQRAFDYLMGGQILLKSSHMSYAFLGHGEYISTRDWHSNSLFIWYDYFSCPQLVARSDGQEDVAELQSAVDSIGRYVQESKYFLVLCPCVAHAETGQLLCRESWKSRGWCRFERVCREFLGQDANIAVIESVEQSYVMTPFDSWLRPACMGDFTVESDRDRVEHLISGMLHAKLVTYLKNQDLHGFRLVLNLEHIYLRKSEPGQLRPRDDAENRGLSLGDFMKENGFKNLHERQFGWSPACFAALRGDVHVLKEMLASRVNVNEQIKADEKRFHVERGMSLLHICAQFSNNVAMALLIEKGANLQLRDGIGASPLVRAGIGNNAEGVQMLIQAGCNPHPLDSFGNNVMRPTSAYGNRDGLRAILALVPDINTAGALHFSVLGEGAPQIIIPELLMAGVNIDEQLKFPRKMRLQFRLLANMAKWLDARHGSYLFFFLTNLSGSTPLICSLLGRSFAASAIFIAAGADVTLRNSAGNSAMDVARAVRAPDFILRGLQGDTAACDRYVEPNIADTIWLSI